MNVDLRDKVRYGILVKCFLAEDSKRITSSSFKVYIPSLMSSVSNTGKENEEKIELNRCMNEEDTFKADSITLPSYIEAKSAHCYMHRLDGWIPEYKTETSTYETITSENGSLEEISASSSSGVTELAANHTHSIIQAFKMIGNSFKKLLMNKNVSKTMVHTNSTEVDFQELNRYFIKRGHVMYGAFIEGEQFEFKIFFIEGATPYLDEVEDKSGNADNPFIFKSGGDN